MNRCVLVLVPFVLVAAACGGTTLGSVTDFELSRIDAVCDWQRRCGVIGTSELPVCKSNPRRYMGGTLGAAAIAAVGAGRARFDGGKAGACIDALSAAGCGDGITNVLRTAPCTAAVVGTVPAGGSCGADVECAAGFCKASGAGCSGTCTAFAPVGGACGAFALCDPQAASCDGKAQVCVTLSPAGGPCASLLGCLPGLVCVGDGTAPGSCQRPGEAGTTCNPDSQESPCATGLYCSHTSRKCEHVQQLGADCIGRFDCDTHLACAGPVGAQKQCRIWLDVGLGCLTERDACPESAPCDAMGTAACTPPSTRNGPCGMSLPRCPLYTYCDPASLSCSDALALGAACAPGVVGQCATGSCDPNAKTCAAACR